MLESIKKLLENKYVVAALYIAACVLINKIIKFVFRFSSGKKGKVGIKGSFLKGALQAVVIIFTVIQVASLSNTLSKFSNTILMSSSLLVVVLGFVFQEGLSNIIHGFILTIFKPFDIGDRVLVNINGETISGYVKSMNLRQTVITGVMDNSFNVIPNALMDKTNVKNLSNGPEGNRYPVTVAITYQMGTDPEKMKKAKAILTRVVLENPLVCDMKLEDDKNLFINVTMEQSSVNLTTFINTMTAEQNYKACSQIREKVLVEYKKAGIDFAYSHIEISGQLETTGKMHK